MPLDFMVDDEKENIEYKFNCYVSKSIGSKSV